MSETDDKSLSESFSIFQRAETLIPSQTQTFSKGWTQYPFGVSPIFVSRADGGYVWDVDDNKYIDWPMALGPLLLGHNYPAVTDALVNQVQRGIAFSLPHELEVSLAIKLVEWFPFVDMVRFGKNGSDATTGAVRAARAFTGKDVILCCGYHGWHDWFIGTTTRASGVPLETRKLTIPFDYNDIDGLESKLQENAGRVAAIIMEPVGVTDPEPEFLPAVRRLSDEHNVVLIFDECWTGFRLHRQGTYGVYGVAPDLICIGKALGNGVPISAVMGSQDIMSVFDEIFFSFTFGGDVLGIVAAMSVLEILSKLPVVEHVKEIGLRLTNGFRQLVDAHGLSGQITVIGYPARHIINFSFDNDPSLLAKSLFQQEAIREGILASAWHAPSYSHTIHDVDRSLDVYDKALGQIKLAAQNDEFEKMLQGTQVLPVFRQF